MTEIRERKKTPATSFYKRHKIFVISVTWVVRLLVGALFVFSGLSKGVDVWGTIFKFREYFGAMGYEVWDGVNLAGVFLLCLLEFLVGFSLLFGCFRRATPIVGAVIMAFMLPLTLWLAVAEPISDCGCFGDALKLSNWGTFWKNVIISAGVIWLLIYNRKTAWVITPYLQWIGAVCAGAYFLAISLTGYFYQPLIDFRPYKTGTTLIDKDEDEETAEEDDGLRFVYEKDGEKHEFSADDELPDEEDGWVFVERKYVEPDASTSNITLQTPKPPTEKSIRFYTEDGHEDVTEEVIGNGRQLILMIPTLSEVPAARTYKINSLYRWAKDNDIEMLATVGGNPREIAEWKDISLAEYPIYTSDDTAIEEVVRGNPAVIYLEDGVIKWKSSLRAIDIDDFEDKQIDKDPMSFARDDWKIFRSLTWIFLGLTALLIFLSYFSEALIRIFKIQKRKQLFKKIMMKRKSSQKLEP